MIAKLTLFLVILVGVLLGTYEVAEFFLKEKEFRKFWVKIWLTLSVPIAVFFWFVLIFYGS